MEKEEFIIRAKELGYSDEYISERIRLYESAAKDGIFVNYEDFVAEPMSTEIESYPTRS